MYLIGDYFVECVTDHLPEDRWTAWARISRKEDWRKLDVIPKAVFVLLVDCPTRRDAEQATIQWAREQVLTRSYGIEKERRQPREPRLRDAVCALRLHL
ncbi:hypothetical protein HDG35_007299 [Paraburkholderia sp. JPY681]|uniref:Uncharacterized protein n=1 Tax=Paraburkholderia atlantica TaxID=2654982 RepID=D5WNT8_PARAM|nr:hypothetical protein BC1002_7227 [Paraburkholderia atlantica]MBB5511002.1 hypothetical protein [Paraburkholderia atlantica]